jgi:predicted transport protein
MKMLRQYVAFTRIKNFACIEALPRRNHLLVYVKLDPKRISLEYGFTRDVTNVGHFGTGDLEITLENSAQLARALPLLQQSYEQS